MNAKHHLISPTVLKPFSLKKKTLLVLSVLQIYNVLLKLIILSSKSVNEIIYAFVKDHTIFNRRQVEFKFWIFISEFSKNGILMMCLSKQSFKNESKVLLF